MAEKKKPELKDGAPATLDELAKEHRTSRENIRKMHFYHGLRSGRPEHEFGSGENKTVCQICKYDSKGNGGAQAKSSGQQDK